MTRKDKAALNQKVRELMNLVGLAQRFVNSYPHELDGGRRQNWYCQSAVTAPVIHRM